MHFASTPQNAVNLSTDDLSNEFLAISHRFLVTEHSGKDDAIGIKDGPFSA